MLRILAVLAVAVAGTSCATFTTLTPGSNSDKGVWVSKTTNFFGIQFSDQEVLYCSTASGAPSCAKAAGDVHAAKVSN
ncbi:MAG TPA: hypothetical protein VMB50_12210 [Myxococcales bacterium]|jgi:hypothetical protein|nr:hypothetical protein [Myxococcales bacterium]